MSSSLEEAERWSETRALSFEIARPFVNGASREGSGISCFRYPIQGLVFYASECPAMRYFGDSSGDNPLSMTDEYVVLHHFDDCSAKCIALRGLSLKVLLWSIAKAYYVRERRSLEITIYFLFF
jgi:hypothetical protein